MNPFSPVLHGLGAWAKPGAKRQSQEGVAGWPDFDPDFAEEPGLVEPYLSAILLEAVLQARSIPHSAFRTPHSALRIKIVRFDRLITLSLMQPLRRMRITHHASRITPLPILMYHSISDDPEPGVSPYYQVNTRPAVFRQHIQFLADHGYRTINLDQLVSWLTTGGEVSAFQDFSFSAFPKPVVLTFDDGFRDFYTEAFPVLQNHGFTATMFLSTAFIGDARRQFRPSTINTQLSTSRECLTWSEIRELRRHGIHFGSHTVNHPKLVELSWPDIEREMLDSKTELENQLQTTVTAFCYPYAFPQTDRQFVRRFTCILSQTGYRSCATTEIGRVFPGADPYRLKRLPANSLDDPGLFQAKLEGSYDWLGGPQELIKRLRRKPH